MSDTTRPSLLLVDDDEVFRTRMARAFVERGYEVASAHDYDSALALARHESPEFAVLDLKMPGKSGLELVKALLEIDAQTKIVVLTGYGSIATALEAIRLGAVHYLTKPTDADRILDAFEHGLEARPRDLPVDTPSLARVEWEHIQRVLADCGGNISEAARVLSMHRRSLQRKLAKYPTPK
jgi:two-component system response regulator RegA